MKWLFSREVVLQKLFLNTRMDFTYLKFGYVILALGKAFVLFQSKHTVRFLTAGGWTHRVVGYTHCTQSQKWIQSRIASAGLDVRGTKVIHPVGTYHFKLETLNTGAGRDIMKSFSLRLRLQQHTYCAI